VTGRCMKCAVICIAGAQTAFVWEVFVVTEGIPLGLAWVLFAVLVGALLVLVGRRA
jgi:hypothetical protein